MKFTIVINAKPESSTSLFALEFCQTLVANKHRIHRLFFLGNGASHAGKTTSSEWSHFIIAHELDAVCCVNSCIAAGLADDRGTALGTLQDGFTISGMGLLAEATIISDRVITFGQR